jgi:acyl-CoA reductase-like NAD-dependent aldehyde dehydrogenase
MRPHRVLVHESVRDRLVEHLGREFGKLDADAKPWQLDLKSSRMLADALDTGARIVMGSSDDPFRFPMVLENVDPTSELSQTDSFLPVLILHTFAEIKHALRIYDLCAYALGASVFGPEANAEKLSKKVNAGFVIINDIIAPTADPRLPFSGRKLSGFGITRGAEGLLELTRVKAVCKRNSNYRHLDPLQPADKNFFLAYLQLAHGPWRKRFSAAINLIRAAAQRSRTSSRSASRATAGEKRTGQ